MIHRLIYELGVSLRNPFLKSHYKFLLESDKWSLEQLQEYQFSKLKELLQFAYQYSSFYKEEFDRVGFNPKSFNSMEDYKRIPIISKQDLLAHKDGVLSNYQFKKRIMSETSGTSGATLKFYRNIEWDSAARAALWRGYHWYGVRPWDKNGYFWGYNNDPKKVRITKILDWLQNRFRVFSYNETDIRQFAEKLKNNTTYIGGYSSMIYETAKIVNKLGIGDDIHLKLIRGTSEKIYESYQKEVQKAFGRGITSQYGSAESGCIAFECPSGNMHIAMENVVVEDVDGEIVVTNLYSHAFPIIRYKLGDSVKLADEGFKCKCGRAHPVITDILGRVGKKIIGKQSSYPSLTLYYLFKNLGLTKNITLNYQAIQNEKGKITLKIEQNEPQYQPDLEIEIEKYFHGDVNFDIQWGQTLHSHQGKLKDFITTID